MRAGGCSTRPTLPFCSCFPNISSILLPSQQRSGRCCGAQNQWHGRWAGRVSSEIFGAWKEGSHSKDPSISFIVWTDIDSLAMLGNLQDIGKSKTRQYLWKRYIFTELGSMSSVEMPAGKALEWKGTGQNGVPALGPAPCPNYWELHDRYMSRYG